MVGAAAAQLPSRTAQGFKKIEIKLRPDYCEKFLGLEPGKVGPAKAIREILLGLDCEVRESGTGEWTVIPPDVSTRSSNPRGPGGRSGAHDRL